MSLLDSSHKTSAGPAIGPLMLILPGLPVSWSHNEHDSLCNVKRNTSSYGAMSYHDLS